MQSVESIQFDLPQHKCFEFNAKSPIGIYEFLDSEANVFWTLEGRDGDDWFDVPMDRLPVESFEELQEMEICPVAISEDGEEALVWMFTG